MARQPAEAIVILAVGPRHFDRRVPAAVSGWLATYCGIEASDLLGRFQEVECKTAHLQGFITRYFLSAIQALRLQSQTTKTGYLQVKPILGQQPVHPNSSRICGDVHADMRGFGHWMVPVPKSAGVRFESALRFDTGSVGWLTTE